MEDLLRMLIDKLNKDYIPKSIIKEKIEELEQDGFCTENDLYKLNREDRYKGNCVKICKNYCVCKVLKELLGGSNE